MPPVLKPADKERQLSFLIRLIEKRPSAALELKHRLDAWTPLIANGEQFDFGVIEDVVAIATCQGIVLSSGSSSSGHAAPPLPPPPQDHDAESPALDPADHTHAQVVEEVSGPAAVEVPHAATDEMVFVSMSGNIEILKNRSYF